MRKKRDSCLKAEETRRKPDIIQRIPVIILTLFLIGVLFCALCSRAEYCAYLHGDNPAWIPQNIPLLLFTAGALFCISMGIYRLGVEMSFSGRKYVTGNILYLSLAVQVLYILLLPANQFADQSIVNRIAQDLIRGNYRAFQKGGYLYQYPNNVGISLVLSWVYRLFPQSMLVPKLLNALCSTATSYLVMRIYEELNPGRRSRSYGILLFSGFFLPAILLNNLVYNDIFATTFFVAAVYYAVRFSKTEKWKHLLWSGFLVSMGHFLRQLGPIFLIAIALFLLLKRARPAKILVFLGMAAILAWLPLQMVNHWLLHSQKIKEPLGKNSIPIHMWIHMGMNEKKIGYWDDGISYNIYMRDGFQNKAKSVQIYSELIRKNLQGESLVKTAEVYVTKNLWLWSEGTYQAEYYGIGSWGYLYPTFATEFFERDTTVRDWVRWILHAANFLMLFLMLYGLAYTLRKKKSYPLILPAIILLGFIGFYTLWEIKPRYIYPTYPYQILMAYYGLNRIAIRFFKDPDHSEDPVLFREEQFTWNGE